MCSFIWILFGGDLETREIGRNVFSCFLLTFHCARPFPPFPLLCFSLLLFFFREILFLFYYTKFQSSKQLNIMRPIKISTINSDNQELLTIKIFINILSFFPFPCRKRFRVNSEDDVNLVHREQPIGKQTKSVQVHN